MSESAGRSIRRRILAGGAIALASRGLALAQQPRARPNLEYFEIAPQPTAAAPRVEVVELFWYGCPFCYQLEPFIDGWLTRKPDDVEFRRMPAVFRQSWVPHARLFHVFVALGELPRLHPAAYKAIHVERLNLADAESAADWAARNGVDRDRFISAYNAPEMDKLVEQSIADTRRYQIKGTPSVVVDGRYVTSTGMSESISGVIGIVDDLVRLTRERRAKA